ncbi:hypothetical protein [Streptomyces sp. NPDC095613]
MDDETAALALAEVVEQTQALDHRTVQATGQLRFDPARHFEGMAARPC